MTILDLPILPHTHTQPQAWFTYRQTGRRRVWPPIKASYSPRHTKADSLQPDHLKHTPYSPQSSGETVSTYSYACTVQLVSATNLVYLSLLNWRSSLTSLPPLCAGQSNLMATAASSLNTAATVGSTYHTVYINHPSMATAPVTSTLLYHPSTVAQLSHPPSLTPILPGGTQEERVTSTTSWNVTGQCTSSPYAGEWLVLMFDYQYKLLDYTPGQSRSGNC